MAGAGHNFWRHEWKYVDKIMNDLLFDPSTMVSCAWWVGGSAFTLFTTWEDVRLGSYIESTGGAVAVTNMNAQTYSHYCCLLVIKTKPEYDEAQRFQPKTCPTTDTAGVWVVDWCMIIILVGSKIRWLINTVLDKLSLRDGPFPLFFISLPFLSWLLREIPSCCSCFSSWHYLDFVTRLTH